MDAVSGEPVSFRKTAYRPGIEAGKLTAEECRQIAADFLRASQGPRWAEVVWSRTLPEQWPEYKPGAPGLPHAFRFEWTRTVNGIRFPGDGFVVGVDAVTSEVIQFAQSWSPESFPDPAGILTPDAALDAFLAAGNGLTLDYLDLHGGILINNAYFGPRLEDLHVRGQTVLAYRPASLDVGCVDARTGEQLGLFAQPLAKPGADTDFADLAGHPDEVHVRLLAAAGVLQGEGPDFRPGEQVRQEDFVRWLVLTMAWYKPHTLYGKPRADWPETEVFYTIARRNGALDGIAPRPGAPVERLEAARMLVNAMGYRTLAGTSGLVNLPVTDADAVPDAYRGHAALAAGLKLVPTSGGRFEPKTTLTRAEAARALAVMVAVQSGKVE